MESHIGLGTKGICCSIFCSGCKLRIFIRNLYSCITKRLFDRWYTVGHTLSRLEKDNNGISSVKL